VVGGLFGVVLVFHKLGGVSYPFVFVLVFVFMITLMLSWLCDGVHKQTSSNHSSS